MEVGRAGGARGNSQDVVVQLENAGSIRGSVRASFRPPRRLGTHSRGPGPAAQSKPALRFRMSGRSDFIQRANADYIEEQYRHWLENPRSVPEDWALFFAGGEFGERKPPAAGGPGSAAALGHAHRAVRPLVATSDPLGLETVAPHAFLELSAFGLSEADLDREVQAPFHGEFKGTLRHLLDALRETYCGTLGAEFMDIPDAAAREWLQSRM